MQMLAARVVRRMGRLSSSVRVKLLLDLTTTSSIAFLLVVFGCSGRCFWWFPCFFFFFFLGSIVATRSSLLFLSPLSLLCNRTTTVGTNSKGKDCTNVQREISWRSYVIFGWASSSFLYQDPLSLLWYLNSMEYDSPPKQKKRDDAFITPLIGASSPFSQ